MKPTLPALLASLLLLPATGALAQTTIVDFTNAAAAQQGAAGKDTDTTSGDAWNFDDSTTPLFDGTAAGSNTRIWGGLSMTWSPTNSNVYNPPFNLLTNGRLYIQNTGGTAGSYSTTIKGMIVWKQENFLNGGSTHTVSFGIGDSMSIGWTQITSTAHTMRFVVNQGGTYYVSSASYTDQVTNQTGSNTVNWSINPTSTTWAPISTSDYSIGTYSARSLTGISAVGLFLDASRTNQQALVSFSDFQAGATLTAIPEPSTYAALAGLGALGLVIWRRRRRPAAN